MDPKMTMQVPDAVREVAEKQLNRRKGRSMRFLAPPINRLT